MERIGQRSASHRSLRLELKWGFVVFRGFRRDGFCVESLEMLRHLFLFEEFSRLMLEDLTDHRLEKTFDQILRFAGITILLEVILE